MYGVDPYLAERSMDLRVHEIQLETETDSFAAQPTARRLGWVSEWGHRLLFQAGRVFTDLGSWLERHGAPPELTIESQASRRS